MNDYFFFSAPQLKRDPLDGPMKRRPITRTEARDLVAELKAMASLGPGPDPKHLARAREIRFQLQGQEWASGYLTEKLDEIYRRFEVLLSARRWRELLSVDGFRKEIKSACARVSTALGERARAV